MIRARDDSLEKAEQSVRKEQPTNEIRVREVEPEECFVVEGEATIQDCYEAYLSDESRAECAPVSALYVPENSAQVVDAVRRTTARGRHVIVSGARTGVTGGAAGVAGASIISLERMDSRTGGWRFQAGVRLEEIPAAESGCLPVDPTEMTASLGGAVATGASGARSYRYGPMRNSVSGLTVVLAGGAVLEVRRGETACANGRFVIEHREGMIVVPVTKVRVPPVKNAAGLHLEDGMDLVDLFVGSEGTLGIITEVEIAPARLPRDRLFFTAFPGDESQAMELIEAVKADRDLECIAIEYLDPNSIRMLRSEGALPGPLEDVRCAVYLELAAEGGGFQQSVDRLLASCGLSAEASWAGFDVESERDMKRFRHLVPETVNSITARRKNDVPGLHKTATDTAVPEGRLREFIAFARSAVERMGIEYVVFGHAGDNHLHLNMLPGSMEELRSSEELCLEIARRSARLGGTVSAEHGIGRLKKELLAIQFTEEELAAMKAVKEALDPELALNPGVMF